MQPYSAPVFSVKDLQLSARTVNRLRQQRDFREREAIRFARLSPRELEVLTLVCLGKTNDEIGEELFLATNTIRTHRNNIWRTLGIHSAVEAVWWAESFDLI